METLQVIIIDLDGTLADTKHDIAWALNSTLKGRSLEEFPLETIAEYVGTGITPLIEQRVPQADRPGFLKEFESSYLSHIATRTRLYDGWEEVFQTWREKKFFILTNKIQLFTNALVDALQINKYFQSAYGREAFPERKPHPLPVLRILEETQCQPHSAVIIGDMPADILCGKAAGIHTTAALYGYGHREELLGLGASNSIECPRDLLSLYA